MKQEVPTLESRASTFLHSPVPATRARVSRTKDRPRVDSPNGVLLSPGSKASPKPSPPEGNNISRVRRPILPTKPKEREVEDPKIADQPQTRTVEQYARVRRHVDTNRRGSEFQSDGKVKDDLQRRLHVSESLVKELQSEVEALKALVEKLQSRNVHLELQNKQLGKDLFSAEEKIKTLEKLDQIEHVSKEIQPSEFKNVRELIANKLDLFPVKREVTKGDKDAKMPSLPLGAGVKSAEIHPKVQYTVPPSRAAFVTGPPPPPPSQAAPIPGPPPPPPLPPPRTVSLRTNTMQKPTALVEFYHSITKRDGKRGHLGSENCASPLANNVHNSIVDELQNRSAHLLAIKADVEKKGDFINHLIQKVQSAAFTDIEEVPTFVDWLDGQLSTLADERAVLKHFSWPERKADALREAAFEYRDLNRLLVEISSFQDNLSLSCEATLKRIAALLDKSERSIQRLIKLRDTTMVSFRDCKISVDWMLDSGMICKIKQASVRLAKVYIKRVSAELEMIRHTERESIQEALLLQGVRFAYRAYQFAGGLDSETMRAFEELRERVQLHRRGSGEFMA